MNSYKDYRYNEVSFKASHNSYELKIDGKILPLTEQITKGCRGLELDIMQSSNGENWSVAHEGSYSDRDDKQLAKYLAELKKWSKNHPDHDVITVHLDLKKVVNKNSVDNRFPSFIDEYIRHNFEETKIYKPGDLIGTKESLAHGAISRGGWPTLKELENKFIFCLTGTGDSPPKKNDNKLKINYAKTKVKERLCFVDEEKETKPRPGNWIYFNYYFGKKAGHQKDRRKENWTDIIKDSLSQPNVIFVTRGYGLDSKKTWKQALNAGINILATDKIDEPWAKVGNTPFVKLTMNDVYQD